MKIKQLTKLTSLCGLSFGVLLTAGCASIVGGTYQSVSIETRSAAGDIVAGVSCKLENPKGIWYLKTPGMVNIRRAYDDLLIYCTKSGERPSVATAKSSTKLVAFGNILQGGLIGTGIDIADGAAYAYPSLITVSESSSVGSPLDSSSFVTIDGNSPDGRENELPTVQREVEGGVETMVAAHADWEHLCKSAGPAPSITMLDTSQHGSVEIKQGAFLAPAGTPPNSCLSGTIYGTQILYSPNPGFHGADSLRYAVVTATGRFTRVVEIAVQ